MHFQIRRLLEHRLQYRDDRQTQQLPDLADEREALAQARAAHEALQIAGRARDEPADFAAAAAALEPRRKSRRLKSAAASRPFKESVMMSTSCGVTNRRGRLYGLPRTIQRGRPRKS